MPTRREGGGDVPTIEPGPGGPPSRHISGRSGLQQNDPTRDDGRGRIRSAGPVGRDGLLGPERRQLATGGGDAVAIPAVVVLGSNLLIPDFHAVVVLGGGRGASPTD